MLRLLPFVWWKYSRYETEQETDFFLGSSVDNSQMWPLQDKVHVPQGRERRIKNCAERKHVRLVSATSRFLICVLPFARAHFSSGYFPHWTSERQIHMNALSGWIGRHMLEMGWFKLINVLLELFVFFQGCMNTCFTIAIWWSLGLSSLLIVLSAQSPSCQVSARGKWYL